MCIRDSVSPIYEQEKWGYSVPYYLTAKYNCNPNYARFYAGDMEMRNQDMEDLLQHMDEEERVMYSESLAREIRARQKKKN